MGDGDDGRRAERFLAELRTEVPGLRVVRKDRSALSRLIDVALRVLTLGGQSAFMTRYVTTIRRTIYVPTSWDARDDLDRYITLRHEAVHLRQFQRFGLLGTAFLYLVPILPMGLALGRARLEWEAYAETLRAIAETRGLAAAEDAALHAYIVRQFTSAAYGYMWPFPAVVRGWITGMLAQIRLESPHEPV